MECGGVDGTELTVHETLLRVLMVTSAETSLGALPMSTLTAA